MRRRDFVTLLGGAAAASIVPLRLHAQQPAMPVVGILRSTSAAGFAHLEAALRAGLKEAGFVEGQNVTIESRYADNQLDRLPALLTDLIRRPVAVIVTNGTAVPAAKAATATVPIVFVTGSDPVRDGFVASLNRPGGNATGTVFITGELGAKRLELLRRLAPEAATLGMLVSPGSIETAEEQRDVQAAAQATGRHLMVLDAGNERDIASAFETLVQRGAGALLVGAGAFLNSHRKQIVALAARHRLPAIYVLRDSVVSGGLMSYGSSNSEAYRQAGLYAGRILKGEKPADLPVMRSTKFEFVLNLKTAKALGLDIPPSVLALADEVIE
jgi:putative ABC transport system substrate-binding protein